MGDKYGDEYVHKLQKMVERHLPLPHRFICITDNATNLHCQTKKADYVDGWWTKLTLFAPHPYQISGKVLYFDLDVVISGDLTPFATFNSDFVAIKDWNLTDMCNSSVMLLETGTQTQIWERYEKDHEAAKRHSQCGDQHWIHQNSSPDYWPEGWCTSYKADPSKPRGSIIVFHGVPSPHQVLDGWVPDLWG